MAGPIYGIFKNIASGKFGTQEGIRIADQAASEMMQKLTYEPESKSLTNFMSAVGDIATKYKLDAAIPQLLTVPIPGPASGRYAGVKTGEEIVDLMERQYAKQREAGEFGERNPLRDILLPTRKEITQSAPPPRSSEPKPVEKNELGLSSKLLETTKGLKQRKGTADQLLGQLKKTLGKENKEIKDSGIEEFLADKKKVNADEVEEFIKKNQPKFVERVGKDKQDTRMQFSAPVYFKERESGYGAEFNQMRNSSIKTFANNLKQQNTALTREEAFTLAKEEYMDVAHLSVDSITGYTIVGNADLGYKIFKSEADLDKTKQYLAWDGKPFGDLPDGSVSKERLSELRDRAGRIEVPLINTLNEAKVQARALAEQRGDIDPVGEGVRFPNETETGGTNYQELRLALDKDETLFTEGVHFPEDKNNIFHVRTTDRVYDGTQDEGVPKPEKVLYVEELQSDWAQRGRNKGFGPTKEEVMPIIDNAAKNLANAEKIFNEMMDGFENKNQNLFNYFNEPLNKKESVKFANLISLPKLPEEEKNTLDKSKVVNPVARKLVLNKANLESLTRKNIIKAVFEETKKNAYRNTNVKVSETGEHNLFTDYGDFPPFRVGKETTRAIYDMTDEIAQIATLIDDGSAFKQSLRPDSKFSNAVISIRNLGESNYRNLEKFKSDIPKAPFVTDTDSWTQLGIKKLLTKAVDEGYDYVSFSPGHVQYKRWDEEGLEEYYDKIIPKNARKVVDKIDKEAVVKLDGNRFKTEDGEGLEADESVPNPFYDSEESLGRYESGEIDFPESEEYGAILPRFSIKITPKLKEKILKEGLPLYKKGGEVSKDTATIIELMKR